MISAPQSDLLIAYGTHPGETGKNNEDRHAVVTFRTRPEGGDLITLALVADGIGGHRAGEVASELAVQTMIETVGQSHERDYRALLEQALTHTAEVVAEQARSQINLMGMGTTLAVALVVGRRLYAAYVGDSRLYLIRNQTIRQISVDHTWVQEAIEHRLITREEAKQHPNRHVVRRHLGGRPDVPADFRLRLSDSESPAQSERNQGLRLHPGEAVLLCSDGLSDLVEEEEILSAFNPHDPQGTVEALIVLARARGGHDNITVVILQAPPTP